MNENSLESEGGGVEKPLDQEEWEMIKLSLANMTGESIDEKYTERLNRLIAKVESRLK